MSAIIRQKQFEKGKNVYKPLAKGMIPNYAEDKKDFRRDFIKDLEGYKTDAYVPQDKAGKALDKSGVTIGAGIDFGSKDEKYLKGVSKETVEKVKPYLGLKGKDAQEKIKTAPLTLEEEELKTLQDHVYDKTEAPIIKRYNKDSKVPFENLTQEQQTHVLSPLFQYGPYAMNKKGVKPWWNAVTNQNWKKSGEELKSWDKKYKSRRTSEAEVHTEAPHYKGTSEQNQRFADVLNTSPDFKGVYEFKDGGITKGGEEMPFKERQQLLYNNPTLQGFRDKIIEGKAQGFVPNFKRMWDPEPYTDSTGKVWKPKNGRPGYSVFLASRYPSKSLGNRAKVPNSMPIALTHETEMSGEEAERRRRAMPIRKSVFESDPTMTLDVGWKKLPTGKLVPDRRVYKNSDLEWMDLERGLFEGVRRTSSGGTKYTQRNVETLDKTGRQVTKSFTEILSNQMGENLRDYGLNITDDRVQDIEEADPSLMKEADTDLVEFRKSYKEMMENKGEERGETALRVVGQRKKMEGHRDSMRNVLKEKYNLKPKKVLIGLPKKKNDIFADPEEEDEYRIEETFIPETREEAYRPPEPLTSSEQAYEDERSRRIAIVKRWNGGDSERELLERESYAREIGYWDLSSTAKAIDVLRKEKGVGPPSAGGKEHTISKANKIKVTDLPYELKGSDRSSDIPLFLRGSALTRFLKANPGLTKDSSLSRGQKIFIPDGLFDKPPEVKEEASVSLEREKIIEEARRRGYKLNKKGDKWIPVEEKAAVSPATDTSVGEIGSDGLIKLPEVQTDSDRWIDDGPLGDGKEYSVEDVFALEDKMTMGKLNKMHSPFQKNVILEARKRRLMIAAKSDPYKQGWVKLPGKGILCLFSGYWTKRLIRQTNKKKNNY